MDRLKRMSVLVAAGLDGVHGHLEEAGPFLMELKICTPGLGVKRCPRQI